MKGNNIIEWKQDAYNMIHSKGKPLACYIYSNDDKLIQDINIHIQAGAIVANSCIFQMALKDVPFGGIGESGFGHYGGKETFKLFTQLKPLDIRHYGLEFFNNDQYPGPKKDLKKLTKVMNKLIPKPKSTSHMIVHGTIKIGIISLIGWYAFQGYKKYLKN